MESVTMRSGWRPLTCRSIATGFAEVYPLGNNFNGHFLDENALSMTHAKRNAFLRLTPDMAE